MGFIPDFEVKHPIPSQTKFRHTRAAQCNGTVGDFLFDGLIDSFVDLRSLISFGKPPPLVEL
jgi:hypothetical protein